MQRIYLGQYKYALVDDQDFDLCSKYSWNLMSGYARAYLLGSKKEQGVYKYLLLHNVIGSRMGFTDKIDHEDRDRLNCQRYNLREATHSQNMANRSVHHNNQLGAKGVHFDARTGKYKVQIGVNGNKIYLGRFESLEEAKVAYKVAAIHYFGEFAHDGT